MPRLAILRECSPLVPDVQAIEVLLCRNGFPAACWTDSLARADQWVAREHLSHNLPAGRTQGLIEPSDVPASIAKELIQPALHKLSDVTAALATRPDSAVGARV